LRGAIVEAEPGLNRADPHRIDHQMEILRLGGSLLVYLASSPETSADLPINQSAPGIENRLHSLLIGVGQRTADALATGSSARMA